MRYFIVLMTVITWASMSQTRTARAQVSSVDYSAYKLPMNCNELLPDHGPFLSFFESTGKGIAHQDKKLARRIFRLLALRERMMEHSGREQNPVDVLIRKTLCFYREQKEPLKAVFYDDPEFLRFLSSAVGELEKSADEALLSAESERMQRMVVEKNFEKNQSAISKIREQAEADAALTVSRITQQAKRKVRMP